LGLVGATQVAKPFVEATQVAKRILGATQVAKRFVGAAQVAKPFAEATPVAMCSATFQIVIPAKAGTQLSPRLGLEATAKAGSRPSPG
jgi:hypothetical protein